MTLRNSFLMACALLSIQLYAQKSVLIIPDDTTQIDKERVQQIQKMVDKINAMPLLSDTILPSWTIPWILYFDNQGQLRKYFSKHDWESERGQTVAYYDDSGELIYFEQKGSSNATDEKEHYYIHNGRIVDFSYYFYCDDWENDKEFLDSDINRTRLAIGNLFVETISEWKEEWEKEWGKCFVHADSLLNHITK